MSTNSPGHATDRQALPAIDSETLTARLEPFDSYWQAPEDIDSGYQKFAAYYRHNYVRHIPKDRSVTILVISCGPGYLVDLLKHNRYVNVVGIDSDPDKIAYALDRGLNCHVARAFEHLQQSDALYDVIVPEQELNHLTMDETIRFLKLARSRLRPGGRIIVYGLNGANPLVGSENLAHNIDHFYTFAEYSLHQVLGMSGFKRIKPYPLKLYVFWRNPANYVGLVATWVMETILRLIFVLYGKNVKVLSKKILATAEVD